MAMYLSGDNLRRIVFVPAGQLRERVLVAACRRAAHRHRGHAAHRGARAVLDALLLGDDAAAHLGVDVRRERIILLALAALVTAAAVALAGLIGFVGLIVPHAVRLVVGPSARLVLPLSALFGAAFMVLADLIARMPGELPVGIVTALIGVPVFLVLLRRSRGV